MGTVATFATTRTDSNGKIWLYRGRVSFNAFGHYCGYLTIPAEHSIIPKVEDSAFRHMDGLSSINGMLEVHGGVTFLEMNSDKSYDVGFDCAHSCDYRADIDRDVFTYSFKEGPDIKLSGAHRFRTRTFVLQQLENLARQIHEVQNEHIASQPS